MFEVPVTGKYHRNAVFVGRGDRFVVLYRASGLDYRRDAELCGFVDVVAEREERVGGECGTVYGQIKAFGTHCGDADGVDSVHLARADADCLEFVSDDDGVGFYVLADVPGEQHGF